jgi:hypothetical protein
MQSSASPLVSAAQMHETISQALKRRFTGLGKVTFASGEELRLLIQAGRICEILLHEHGKKKRLSGEHWTELFPPLSPGQLLLCKSPGRLLLFERACFEMQAQETRQNVSAPELEKLFLSFENRESATIATIQWPQAQARVLFSGSMLKVHRAVFIRDVQNAEDDPNFISIRSQQDSPSRVEIYRGGLASDPWIAIHLNILFEFFCGHILRQYEYLTGKVMVESILKNVTIHASQQDWDMEGIHSNIVDQTLFDTIDDMTSAYKEILALVEGQMKSIIGASLLAMLKNQGAEALNAFYLSLSKLYGFDL